MIIFVRHLIGKIGLSVVGIFSVLLTFYPLDLTSVGVPSALSTVKRKINTYNKQRCSIVYRYEYVPSSFKQVYRQQNSCQPIFLQILQLDYQFAHIVYFYLQSSIEFVQLQIYKDLAYYQSCVTVNDRLANRQNIYCRILLTANQCLRRLGYSHRYQKFTGSSIFPLN